MKTNILKLSALLTILTMSGAMIVAKDKATTSKGQSKEQTKQVTELKKALKADDVQKLQSFSIKNPLFDLEGKYSNLIPNTKLTTPLMAGAHHGASDIIDYLLQKIQVRNVAATDENELTALDHAIKQIEISSPKNKAKYQRIISALRAAEYQDFEPGSEIIDVSPVIHDKK